jgi:hypothetical protein
VDHHPIGRPGAPSAFDTSVPNSARIWNYWLGGKDNFAADRAAGDQFLATYPAPGLHGGNSGTAV